MKFKSLLTMVLACCAVSSFALSTDAVFDSGGVKIRYVTEGEGEPVVLIHGWMSDSTMWGRDASGNTKLSPLEGFQIIAMDCRGHGKSDKPHEQSQYGTEMAEDVLRLLDHLKIKKAHLVGYSMGAFIAGRVVATHPERVISVVYGGQAPLIIGTKAGGSSEVEAFAKAVDEGKGLGPYLMEVNPPDKPKLTLEMANTIAKYLYAGKDVKAFAVSGLSLGDLAVNIEDLKKSQAPILFVHGSKDPSVARIASVQKLIGRGDLKIIEGADHITTLINPKFGAAVVEFLQANKTK